MNVMYLRARSGRVPYRGMKVEGLSASTVCVVKRRGHSTSMLIKVKSTECTVIFGRNCISHLSVIMPHNIRKHSAGSVYLFQITD